MSSHKVITKLSIERSLQKAIQCLKRSEFSKSCAYFCVAFKLSSNEELTDKCRRPTYESFGDNETIMKTFITVKGYIITSI
jgi:hypothetical protein